MKKRVLSLLLAVVMLLATMPLAAVAAPKRAPGELRLKEMVDDGGVKTGVFDWLTRSYSGDPYEILNDLGFVLYESDALGNELDWVAGGVIGADSMITFSPEVDPGWYLVREVPGTLAAEIFEKTDDLLVYFDGENALAKQSAEFSDDTTFTIQQYFGAEVSRPVQVIYESGFYLRTTPQIDDPDAPNGGGALGTSKFIATADDGTTYTSFCADIGAVGVKGTYYVDKTNHGFSDEEMRQLVAAIDYIYSKYTFEEYEALALTQLIVWNMIIQNDEGPSISDNWIRRITDDGIVYYTDEFGKIVKVEGYNNTNGSNPWYTDEYRALVDDIIADPEKYVEIYDAKIASGDFDKFVSEAVFLVGDQGALNIYQQRQLIVLFGGIAEYDNTPVRKKN